MNTRLAALYESGQTLVLMRDVHDIARTVLEIAARVLDFQDSEFLLVDEARRDLHPVARHGQVDHSIDVRFPLDSQQAITVAAARSRQLVYIPDVRKDPRYVSTGFAARSAIAVPLQFEERVLGVLNVVSSQRDAFSEIDQKLLSALASQAALALENARVHAEERRQADKMLVLSKLTRQISVSLDLQATLDAIAAAAAELIPCALSEISLWDEQTQLLTLRALTAEPSRACPLGVTYPPGSGYTGWLVRHQRPLLVPDVDARHDIRPHLLSGELPYAAYAGVPLLLDEELIGILVLVANETGAFGESHVDLLETLAAQAAVAIRNARLYEQVARRHRELASLFAVAESVNRPLDLQEILQDAVDRVIEVTHAQGGAIRLLDASTEEVVLAAHRGLSDTYIEAATRFPLADEIVGWVARTAEPSLSEDMWTDPRVSPEVCKLLKETGHRSLAQVPLCSQDRVVGTLGVVAQTTGFFDEADLQLLKAIGQQLGVAIANAQLFEDTQRKARRLAALNAVAEAVNRPGDLEQILGEGLSQALTVTGLEMGAIALRDMERATPTIKSHQGMSAELVTWLNEQLRQKPIDTWPAGEDIQIDEIPPDDTRVPALVREQGLCQSADVPLFAEGELVGILSVVTRQIHPFRPEERSLLRAIGHQLGTAVTTARLRQEAIHAERLAAVGRVAASVAHDLRSPLGGILRSAEFLARPELSTSTRQRLSQAVVSLARRLLGTTQEILDYVRGQELPLHRVPHSLPAFLDQVLAVLEVDFSDRGIEVVRQCHYQGPVVMDAGRMAQVVYNIAANARDAMPNGGTFSVTTQQTGSRVELRFADEGPGVPAEVRHQIFEPFFTYGKREGAGLGLSIARRIVEEHGGDLWLESTDGQGATFVVSLPA